jgi:hypothetical protein
MLPLCFREESVPREDKIHFIFVCPHQQQTRAKYLAKLLRVQPNFDLTSVTSVIGLMCSSDDNVQVIVADMAAAFLQE